MCEYIKSTLRENSLFWAYTLVFLMILYGVYEVSEFKYISDLSIYFGIFISAYWILLFISKKLSFTEKKNKTSRTSVLIN